MFYPLKIVSIIFLALMLKNVQAANTQNLEILISEKQTNTLITLQTLDLVNQVVTARKIITADNSWRPYGFNLDVGTAISKAFGHFDNYVSRNQAVADRWSDRQKGNFDRRVSNTQHKLAVRHGITEPSGIHPGDYNNDGGE